MPVGKPNHHELRWGSRWCGLPVAWVLARSVRMRSIFSTNAFVVHAHLLQPTPSDLRGAGSMSHRLLFANHVFFLHVDGGHSVVGSLLPRGSRSNSAGGGDRRRVIHYLASARSAYNLGLFDLPGLLAAAPAIVFQREGDF